MFDVPPPYDGLRGIDAYRDSWPDFFEWQRQGAIFEITELDVTAGDMTTLFSNLKAGLAAPLGGMGTAFSCSLFGLTGSLMAADGSFFCRR